MGRDQGALLSKWANRFFTATLIFPFNSLMSLKISLLFKINSLFQILGNWDTSSGASSYQEKLLIAYGNMQKMQNSVTPTLGSLNTCQLEEMALALYGPYAGGTAIASQYYIPTCNGTVNGKMCTGNWQWSINDLYDAPEQQYCAVCYVTDVRDEVFPGGSTSECTVTSPLPDPPNIALLTYCDQCLKLPQ